MNVSSRRKFIKHTALGAVLPLGACSTKDDGYERAVVETWRPFDERVAGRARIQRELVRYATLAPSSHNTQCWRFQLGRSHIEITPDPQRRCPAVDPDDHHLFVSLGCAAENLVQAGRANGLEGNVRFGEAGLGTIRIALERTKTVRSPLFDAIPHRQCARDAYDAHAVSTAELRILERVAQGAGVRVLLVTARPAMESIADYVVRGNTAQMNDSAFMAELRSWIRFNDAEAVAKRDGLFSRASGNPSVPGWLGGLAMKYAFTAKGENEKYARFIRSSAGIAIFVSDANDREHWVETGRCYERFVLQATAMGIQTAMINQPVEVPAVRRAFATFLGIGQRRPDLVVRFGYGPLLPRSLRRPIEAVITESV